MKKLVIIFLMLATIGTNASEQALGFRSSQNQVIDVDYSWMFNVGSTRMENVGTGSASGFSVQGQYVFNSLSPRLSAGMNFSHYDYSTADGFANNFQNITALGEYQAIQADLIGESVLFAAVNSGLMRDLSFPGTYLIYGAGLGVKFNEQIGLRLDVKAGRQMTTANSFSLIGYY